MKQYTWQLVCLSFILQPLQIALFWYTYLSYINPASFVRNYRILFFTICLQIAGFQVAHKREVNHLKNHAYHSRNVSWLIFSFLSSKHECRCSRSPCAHPEALTLRMPKSMQERKFKCVVRDWMVQSLTVRINRDRGVSTAYLQSDKLSQVPRSAQNFDW